MLPFARRRTGAPRPQFTVTIYGDGVLTIRRPEEPITSFNPSPEAELFRIGRSSASFDGQNKTAQRHKAAEMVRCP
jgi:hypothetical protein